jgi:hypothetical protein
MEQRWEPDSNLLWAPGERRHGPRHAYQRARTWRVHQARQRRLRAERGRVDSHSTAYK